MKQMRFGTLSIYGEDGIISKKLEVAKFPRENDITTYGDRNSEKFRIVNILKDSNWFTYSVCVANLSKVGEYVHLDMLNDTYYFQEEEGCFIQKKYNKLIQKELETPWTFKSSPIVENEDGTYTLLDEVSFTSKEPSSLNDAIRWLFENRPDCYMGCSISKCLPGGDFCINSVPEYYLREYGCKTIKETLMCIAEDKGYNPKMVELCYPSLDEEEIDKD